MAEQIKFTEDELSKIKKIRNYKARLNDFIIIPIIITIA